MHCFTHEDSKSNKSCTVIHINHFQSLILADIQCIAERTSSSIIDSQAAELINSYSHLHCDKSATVA